MKPRLEGAEAPDMICLGRQYDDDLPFEVDAVTRFNDNARLHDPYQGHNLVLDRIHQFDSRRPEYEPDLEPELDEYVQTLFLAPQSATPSTGERGINAGLNEVDEDPDLADATSQAANAAFAEMFGETLKEAAL